MYARRPLSALIAAALGATVLSLAGPPAPAFAATTDPVAIGPYQPGDDRVLEVVTTANGSPVVANPYHAGTGGADVDTQRWTVELTLQVDEEVTPIYTFRNVASGRCLTKSGTGDGGAVTVNDCTGAANQEWTVSAWGAFNGVALYNVADFRCLDLAGGSTEPPRV
jgi:hypothetical protein